MKEQYLHLIWKMKRMPFHKMKLTNGSSFEVVDPGTYNRNESGPDFLNARIKIDGILWVGPVEIHVRSSDWFKHRHQTDEAYNNVILHVVFIDDSEITQAKRKIECLELRSFIDFDHYAIFKDRLVEDSIPCRKNLPSIDPVFIRSMIDRSVVSKLESKYAEICQMQLTEDQDVLFRLLARAFGAKVNELPFDELAIRLTQKSFKIMSRSQKKRVVCLVSGLYTPETELELYTHCLDHQVIRNNDFGTMAAHSWKYKGLRPASFPDVRVGQFAEVIAKMDFNLFLNPIDAKTMKELIYFQFKEVNNAITEIRLKISKGFIDQLIVNCFVPFVFWKGKKSSLQGVCDNAFELLDITDSESNYVISLWKDLGIRAGSAHDSQGLLELYNRCCVKKKCLTCTVGNKILER